MTTAINHMLSAYLSNSPDSCMELLRQCHSIGKSLNHPGQRFNKAKLIDKKYAMVFPYLKYVDEIGYDWMFCGHRVSGKSQQSIFQKREQKTSSITITNKQNGAKQNKNENKQTFDYIILTQSSAPYAIAVASYEDIKKYFLQYGDKVAVSIPYEHLDFIVHPSENIDFLDEPIYDYGKLMDAAIDDVLRRASYFQSMLAKGIIQPKESCAVC